jgi:hypothetical protein
MCLSSAALLISMNTSASYQLFKLTQILREGHHELTNCVMKHKLPAPSWDVGIVGGDSGYWKSFSIEY